ncbi:MAG: hypothetical protein GXY83_41485 [Rhodopirellula sp.]|nr:hypothetical protein [Rhodopirellula sp.]
MLNSLIFRLTLSIASVSLLLGAPSLAVALDVHVAVNGRDTWSGRLPKPNAAATDGPFASLERARGEVRQLKKAGGSALGAVTIWVAPGVYPRQQTLELDSQDSGTAEAPVVYRGTAAGESRLLGGRMLPAAGWGPVGDPAVLARLAPEVRTEVRQLSLRAAGIPEPGPEWNSRFKDRTGWPELFFAGRRMPLARWPNSGWARIVDVVGGEPFDVRGTVGDKVGKFIYEGDRPRSWLGEPELWLHGYWFWDWSDQRQKVESLDVEQRTITLAPPSHHYGYRKKARWCAFNALAELDSPGEWCVDRASWTLYFLPPEAAAEREAAFSLLGDPLLRLTNVEHVTIRDLIFEVARGDGVQISGGATNLVAGCTFRNLGRLGVRIDGGTNHGVRSCDLYNLGAGGISLTGGDRRTLTPAGHYAENNHIHHFAELAFSYQNAIRLGGVGCRIVHNLIHDTVHEALTYSGNDHMVELNEVYDVCLEADDSGVIHQGRDWTWRGNVIRHNFFHHIPAGNAVSNMGVYLDDMECGTLVYGNVLYRIPRAVLVGGGRDNTVQNNVIIDCPISIHIDNRAMNWAGYHVGTTMKGLLDKVPYQAEPWRNRYPLLVDIWEDEPAVPKGNTVRDNLMVSSGPFALASEVTRYGTVTDNLFLQKSPGSVSPAAGDFRFEKFAAEAAQIPGFQPVPFDQIGLCIDEYRTRLPLRDPVIQPEGGVFVDELLVAIHPGRGYAPRTLHYTLDGSRPTCESPLYSKPFRLTETATVQAIAFGADERESSGVCEVLFTARHLGPNGSISVTELPAVEPVAHGGLKQNSNYAGNGPVSLAGRTYERSLMLCPEASPAGGRGSATYELSGGLDKATRFCAVIGVDDAVKPNGTVVFIVEVFRGRDWAEVWRSRILRGGEAEAIRIPVAGAAKLRLITSDAGDNIHSDHAVWAEPLLQ